MENLSLIDVSSQDDLLISSSSDRHRDLRSSGLVENQDGDNCFALESVDAREEGNLLKMSKQWEHVPEMSESPEQKRAKSGKVNLRKSLAWDSAFFTSEGVLNTEELAIVNSTFRKTELCSLPGIQEDLRLSTESTSTLDSESYKLENLEGDLFENVRASIQQSLSKCNNCPSGKSETPRISSRKKVELAFQTKMKRPVTLKRDGISGQRLECNSKEAVLGVKEAAKATGVSKLLLKPPRVVPKSIVPSNKGSSGSTQMKDNTRTLSGNGANRQGIVTFNNNEVSTRMTSRPVSSMKPNASSHLGTMLLSTSSCLSNSSPLNSSSHLKDNSPLELRRKRNSSRNSEQPLSGSKHQNISHSKSRASSTFKFSSSASPRSSMDSIISEASSSTSTVKPSSSVESFASSTSSSPSLRVPTHQPHIRKESSVKLLHARPTAKVPVGTRVLSESSNRDHARSSINNNTGFRSSKPSGLRMPSPKFGYFDAEKSLARNSNKISQIGLRSNLLEGNSGTRADAVGTNRPKSSKIPSIRPVAHKDSSPIYIEERQSMVHKGTQAAHKDSSPISIEESQSMVHKGTQAAYQLDKEEKLEQSGTFDSASVRVEKENLIPAHEMNCSTRSPTECQKLSALDIMGKKMSSLSISSDLVGGN